MVDVDGAGAGAGSEVVVVVVGVDVVVVVVDVVGVDVLVLVEPLLVAPSDIHHPPLSGIQWYPPGQDPLLVLVLELPPDEVLLVVVFDMQ